MSKPVGASPVIDPSVNNRPEASPPRKTSEGARSMKVESAPPSEEGEKTASVVKRTFSPRITREQSPRIQQDYHSTPSPLARKGMLAALKKEEEKQ